MLTSGETNLQNSTKKNVTVSGLKADTEYTFVVFAITLEGVVYGEPATKKFKTNALAIKKEYQINPAWTVTYIGDFVDESGEVYEHVVTVETKDTNPFFVTAWPANMFEEYGIEAITEMEIEGWKEFFAENTDVSFEDIVSLESIMTQVLIEPNYGTEWYVMAIGCDTEGNPTGLYALSELVDLENIGEEEEPTEAYSAWLGDWTFTGANGVSFDVTMSKGKANKTYKLSGWEGPESEGLDITVEWLAGDDVWVIYSQKVATEEFENYGKGDIWLIPQDTEEYIYPFEDVPVCIGGFLENGQAIVEGYYEEFQDGTYIEMATMLFLVNFDNDEENWYGVTETKAWPTFPFTITPATKARQQSVNVFKGGKKVLNPFAHKTYKTYDICEKPCRTL